MEKVENSRRGALAFGRCFIIAVLAMLVVLQQLSSTSAASPPPPPPSPPPPPPPQERISNCTRRCGNIDIPYPFGIEPGCYHAAGFNLTCKKNNSSPELLFLGDGTVQVLEISVPLGTVHINSSRVGAAVVLSGHGRGGGAVATGKWNGTWGSGHPRGGPFFLSESISPNSVVVMGCNVRLDLWGGDDELLGSCTAVCPPTRWGSIVGSTRYSYNCGGVGCCQEYVILGYSSYKFQIHQFNDDVDFLTSIYIVDGTFNYTTKIFTYMEERKPPEALPATLDWVINNSTSCPVSGRAPECRSTHSNCTETAADGHPGYLCKCDDGYQGNPYVLHGCQDIDECISPDIYNCYGLCENTEGGFTCKCPTGHVGNASVPDGCKDINECENPEAHSCYGTCLNFLGTFQCQCPNGTYGNPFTQGGCITIKESFSGLSIGLVVGGGTSLLLLVLGGPFIVHKIKQQKLEKIKQKFFNQNHGLLLKQLISQKGDIGERMIVTLRDLEKATNNFDKARVIGGGGHDVVFKGILDLHVVAIKKSKIVVQREINDFINEVVVLSQVNHRNVVRLLGCCLETEVPLLIYEFVSNGTLYEHLHVEGSISLSWDDRIRIAMEVTKALSYLHSSASIPIFHRDIKSPNILLDDMLTAKVSDFGASRYIPIDQTGVITAVQGTIGYLDPMYYYTGRLTDKSDVFSFGVLLVELLTRKKPFAYRSDGDDSLVSHFVSLLIQGKLYDIIDPQVKEEENGEVEEVAKLAAMCIKLKGEDRPTMREVEMTLENILVTKKDKIPFHVSRRKNDDDGIVPQYMSSELAVTQELSRQYTMEKEILSSAGYPR